MAAQDSIWLDLPARYKYLNLVSAQIKALLEHTDQGPQHREMVAAVQLAVHEACTNIVEHAYAEQPGGRLRIQLELLTNTTPHRLVVDLYDTGNAFQIAHVRLTPPEEASEGGYGLYLMHTLLDEVHYTPQSAHNHWRLVKYVPGDDTSQAQLAHS